MATRPVCVVLGAGVSALTCALRLLEQGWEVHVVAKDTLEQTTSIGAGAIWEFPPFLVGPQEQAEKWVLESLPVFEHLGSPQLTARTGVRVHRSYSVWRKQPKQDEVNPEWAPRVHDFRVETAATLGNLNYLAPDCHWGFSYSAPVVYMKRYLPWLIEMLDRLGGFTFHRTTLRSVSDLEDVIPGVTISLIVNCLSMGSIEVFGDKQLYPSKGQLVLLRAPGIPNFSMISDETDMPDAVTYIIPQLNGIIACGGISRLNDWDTKPCPAVAANIHERCAKAIPALKDAEVVGHWAGLRPCRHGGIRLEKEIVSVGKAQVPVIHNYGHGGSGIVIAWGCATEVARLARECAARSLGLRPAVLPPELAAIRLETAPIPARL